MKHSILLLMVLIAAAGAVYIFISKKSSQNTMFQKTIASETRIRSTDGMTMVHVPAGEFEMGSGRLKWIRCSGSLLDDNLSLHIFRDERPRHTVYLDAFWIDRTEVTVDMFLKFVEVTGYITDAENEEWGKPWKDGPKEME